MPVGLKTLLQYALRSVRDLTPIVLVIGSFQLFLIQAPLDGVLRGLRRGAENGADVLP